MCNCVSVCHCVIKQCTMAYTVCVLPRPPYPINFATLLLTKLPRVGPGHPPLNPFPVVHLLRHLLFFTFPFLSLALPILGYFLLLSTPSLSTRIVPLRFQAGGRRKRPNLGLVCFMLSVFLSLDVFWCFVVFGLV